MRQWPSAALQTPVFVTSKADSSAQKIIELLSVSAAHPREVLAESLADRAAVILFGVPLRDHVIITRAGYFSFRERGSIG